MTRWFIVIYHRRTSTGWTGSLMGCEQRKQTRFQPWRGDMSIATHTRKSSSLVGERQRAEWNIII
jgi:hypothetical protein